MRKQDPSLAGNDLHQILLDFLRIVLRRQLQPARDAMHVGVDDHAFGLPEPCSQHDVRGFAGDAGKREQFFHVVGNLPPEVRYDLPCGSHDGLGFVAEESGRPDIRLELFGSERGKRLRPSDIFGTTPALRG